MHRSPLSLLVSLLGAIALVTALAAVPGSAAATPRVRISWPSSVRPGEATAIRLTFPSRVTAVDGRLLFDDSNLELVGVAPVGGGTGLLPVVTTSGAAFGAYDLRTVRGKVRLDLVVVSSTRSVRARVAVESIATRTERPVKQTRRTRREVAIARADWERVRLAGVRCGASRTIRRLDVDQDGCGDVADIEAVRSGREHTDLGRATSAIGSRVAAASSLASPGVITVDSSDDTPDVLPGDGLCADAEGRCTLRAAISESELLAGDITIEFDLAGTAPVTIALGSRLPYITRLGASLTIDGYSQPGSSVNTATYGSNAVPGVRLRGNGVAAHEVGLYVTSGGNVIRGLILSDLYRGIMVDGPDAAGNRIMGNWIGFDQHGHNDPMAGIGVLLNTGATDTRVGSAARADRNVIGNFTKAVGMYGPGTRRSIISGNLLCIAPRGGRAPCSVGVDHDFGPRDGLVGGDGPGQRNIIGPTRLEGIELSHGWDPDGGDDSPWRITGNRIVGNWIGFRYNGAYDASYRSGYHDGAEDSTGIHVWDGAADNLVVRNHIASVHDGIRIRSSTSRGNELVGNVIGVSPRGEPAPLKGWGISVSQGLRHATLRGNRIRYARLGGVGLLSVDVLWVRISRTTVGHTDGPAIRLARHGSDGANHHLAAPHVTNAAVAATGVKVRGTGRAGAIVELYRSGRSSGRSGLPVTYLGRVGVSSTGSWHTTVDGLRRGDRVTALQITDSGDTSAMSLGVAVRP